jgi:hypothetical protein
MREADRVECAAKGRSPHAALRFSLAASSMALTAMVDGSPHAMMGVSPVSLASSLGCPWFLGTDEVMRQSRALLEYGPRVVAAMHGSFRRLENVVSADNARAILLLERLGFEVGDDAVLIGGVRFVPFWRGVNV